RRSGCCGGWYDGCVDAGALPELTISGVWGYHGRGTPRWKTVGTLAADMTDSATSITVNNLASTPAAIQGESDSDFSAGCLFRLDDEYLSKSYSASGNVVERGIHGSVAAAHAA